MTEIDAIFQIFLKYSHSPISWLLIPLLLLYISKRFLFAGAWRAVQAIIDHYFADRQKHLENQIKLEEDLRALAARIKDIAEGLWESRRLLDDKIAAFEDLQKNTLFGVREILTILPKRKSDYATEPAK